MPIRDIIRGLGKSGWEYSATILGEPASKANSRKIVRFGNRPASIKSEKARNYEKLFRAQAKVINPLIDTDVLVFIEIFYKTRRPDLDESLILDLLQGCAYENDRQVKSKIILHNLDKDRPRSVIRVRRFIKQ